MDKDTTLFIEYKDGSGRIIHNVKGYGLYQVERVFWFRKDKKESFIPMENVKFFGDFIDYLGPEYA